MKWPIGESGAEFKQIGIWVQVGIIVVLGIGLAAINIASTDIWADEACTLATVENGFAGITYATEIDVHPPLYYYLVKLFYCFFGVNEADALRRIFWGRLISLLPLIIVFLICIGIGIKRRAGKWLLWYPFMVCQYLPVISCSCEIRMYSWTWLFVTIVGAVILYMEGKKSEDSEYSGGYIWVILVSVTLCVCYTHYFAVLPVIVMWFVLGLSHITDKCFMIKFLAAWGGIAIGYIPWMIIFVRQFNRVHEEYWIPETSKDTVNMVNRYLLPSDGRVRLLFYIMLLLLMIYSVRIVLRGKASRDGIWGIVMMLMPWILIVISVGLSKIYRSILVPRYIVPALGIAGMGEWLLLRKMFQEDRIFMKIVASCFCAMAIILSVWNIQKCFEAEETYGSDWNEMIKSISERNGNDFVYIQGGGPMVRPFTVMFPEDEHICENANMTEYNQFLFGTINYEQQDIDPPYFIITASDSNMPANDFTDYLGKYNTYNGEYAVYYLIGR